MLDFNELYDSYKDDVYRFAFWLSGDPTEAEDIASETFVRAWASRNRIRTETLKAYLLTIARNIYLNAVRKRKPQTPLTEECIDPASNPEQQAGIAIEIQRVRKVLMSCNEIDRAAFVMRVQHELPYAEIARVLKISLSTAKVKVHRVRKRLLGLWNDEEGSP